MKSSQGPHGILNRQHLLPALEPIAKVQCCVFDIISLRSIYISRFFSILTYSSYLDRRSFGQKICFFKIFWHIYVANVSKNVDLLKHRPNQTLLKLIGNPVFQPSQKLKSTNSLNFKLKYSNYNLLNSYFADYRQCTRIYKSRFDLACVSTIHFADRYSLYTRQTVYILSSIQQTMFRKTNFSEFAISRILLYVRTKKVVGWQFSLKIITRLSFLKSSQRPHTLIF